MEEKEWEMAYEEWRRDKRVWEEVKPRAFQLFLQHCNEETEQKLNSLETWSNINDKHNLIELLKAVRSIAHKHDEVKGGVMNHVEQDICLYVHSFQRDHKSIMDYYKKFNAQCDVIDVHGGKAGYHPGLYNKYLDEIKDNVARGISTLITLDEMKTKAMETSCEEYKASLFMRLANENRFKDLKNQLDDMNLFNREAYPKTMDQALHYLQNYKGKRGSSD